MTNALLWENRNWWRFRGIYECPIIKKYWRILKYCEIYLKILWSLYVWLRLCCNRVSKNLLRYWSTSQIPSQSIKMSQNPDTRLNSDILGLRKLLNLREKNINHYLFMGILRLCIMTIDIDFFSPWHFIKSVKAKSDWKCIELIVIVKVYIFLTSSALNDFMPWMIFYIIFFFFDNSDFLFWCIIATFNEEYFRRWSHPFKSIFCR